MEEKRIGVYVCWCGTNIARMVDVENVASEIKNLPNVVLSKNYKYMCSDPGQALIIKDIKEHNLNRVVVASCSPRMHEITFRKVLENAGLNPYMFEMANIREHVSWVHTDRNEATKKAQDLIAAAISRVQWHESLEKRSVEVHPATLILGGGISGITAALEIADAGKKVYLVEKTDKLGGLVARLDLTFPHFYSAKQIIDPLINRVQNHHNIKVLLNTTAENISGYMGNFKLTLGVNGQQIELSFGNIIVATGLSAFNPEKIHEYGYKAYPDVITSLEFEKMLKSGKIETSDGKEPRHIVVLHCVGSRNNDFHPYCSRVCCMSALKYSAQLRSALPKASIYEVYADMRAFGKGCEEFYSDTSRKGIMFLVYNQRENLPEIRRAPKNEKCKLLVEFRESLSGNDVEVPADLVVLMTAMEANKDIQTVAHAVGVSMCGNGFYIERHPKLDPVATTTDGVYVVGTCQSPKDIPDSVSQARAAAARILATIEVGSVNVEVTTAVVSEDICCGCQTCISVCPYTAISFDHDKKVSMVNEILCKGCGTCGSACPTGAIHSRHFTDLQILSQIEGLISGMKSKKTLIQIEET